MNRKRWRRLQRYNRPLSRNIETINQALQAALLKTLRESGPVFYNEAGFQAVKRTFAETLAKYDLSEIEARTLAWLKEMGMCEAVRLEATTPWGIPDAQLRGRLE